MVGPTLPSPAVKEVHWRQNIFNKWPVQGLPGQRNNQTASSLLDCEYIWLSHMCYIIYTDTRTRWPGMIIIESSLKDAKSKFDGCKI